MGSTRAISSRYILNHFTNAQPIMAEPVYMDLIPDTFANHYSLPTASCLYERPLVVFSLAAPGGSGSGPYWTSTSNTAEITARPNELGLVARTMTLNFTPATDDFDSVLFYAALPISFTTSSADPIVFPAASVVLRIMH